MKFNKERFVYTFNGNTSMTLYTSHTFAKERSDLHELLTEQVKLKYAQFSMVGFF